MHQVVVCANIVFNLSYVTGGECKAGSRFGDPGVQFKS